MGESSHHNHVEENGTGVGRRRFLKAGAAGAAAVAAAGVAGTAQAGAANPCADLKESALPPSGMVLRL